MTSFSRGDVCLVAFPYVEHDVRRRRPALVVSEGPVGLPPLLWVLMITSSANSTWPTDVDCGPSYAEFGLRISSFVRTAKIAMISPQGADHIGALSAPIMQRVDAALRNILTL